MDADKIDKLLKTIHWTRHVTTVKHIDRRELLRETKDIGDRIRLLSDTMKIEIFDAIVSEIRRCPGGALVLTADGIECNTMKNGNVVFHIDSRMVPLEEFLSRRDIE
jgi:hypothetical protein